MARKALPDRLFGPQAALDFERLWSLYPRRTNRAYALKCFRKALDLPEWPGIEEVLEAVKRARNLKQWQGKTFIPHLSTWLNRQQWQDQHDPSEFVRLVSGCEKCGSELTPNEAWGGGTLCFQCRNLQTE